MNRELILEAVVVAARQIPLGFHQGRVMIGRWTKEEDVVKSLQILNMWLDVLDGRQTTTEEEIKGYIEKKDWPL